MRGDEVVISFAHAQRWRCIGSRYVGSMLVRVAGKGRIQEGDPPVTIGVMIL